MIYSLQSNVRGYAMNAGSAIEQVIDIPERLLPFEKLFNDNRKERKGCKCTASYRDIYALAMNAELSLEDIGRLCGGRKKQWTQQMLDTYYPGVRPRKNGRRQGTGQHGKRARDARARLRKSKIESAFRESCVRFKLLTKHAKASGFVLAPSWRNGMPMHKEAYIDDEKCFVMLLTSPSELQPSILYAHSISPMESTLKGFANLVLVVEIDKKGVRASRVYKIPVGTFLEKKQTNILIRLSDRKIVGARKSALDWSQYLISKFA